VIALVVGPASANKDPVTPQQLKAYEDAFMEQVRTGDLLFHGDAATAKKMNVVLTTTGMACAMCSAAKGKKSWSPVMTSAGMFKPLSLGCRS